MNGCDLLREMDIAASRVRLAHLERLRSIGCPYPALAKLNAEQHTIGVAKVRAHSDGLFDYADDGLPAFIVAVVDPDRDLGDAGIFDLVAFSPDEPARWWGRTGAAFALGDHLLEMGDPVRVVATPLDWLTAEGDALCILDWSSDSPTWGALRVCPRLLFNSAVLARKVRNAMVLAAPMPTMEMLSA